MPEADDLSRLIARLDAYLARASTDEVKMPLTQLLRAASEVGKAWSGSWVGYQALVYYDNLRPPPPGAHFSREWGMQSSFSPGTTGDWMEYTFDGVKEAIFKIAGSPDLAVARAISDEGRGLFEDAREELLSLLEIQLGVRADAVVGRLRDEAKAVKVYTADEAVDRLRPRGSFYSHDAVAMHQGIWTPPHIAVEAEVFHIKSPAMGVETLLKIARRASSHLDRVRSASKEATMAANKVFIGHGRSFLWRDLKDFLQDRLSLPWDEFNRVPIAGFSNINRLMEMLDSAAMAFVVMTGEDEMAEGGKLQARMNVVHEAGLFQGRLGFSKAIVLLEEGCEEFSNIQGLGQIRFPKGNIKACFEEIRRVLEREGLLQEEA